MLNLIDPNPLSNRGGDAVWKVTLKMQQFLLKYFHFKGLFFLIFLDWCVFPAPWCSLYQWTTSHFQDFIISTGRIGTIIYRKKSISHQKMLWKGVLKSPNQHLPGPTTRFTKKCIIQSRKEPKWRVWGKIRKPSLSKWNNHEGLRPQLTATLKIHKDVTPSDPYSGSSLCDGGEDRLQGNKPDAGTSSHSSFCMTGT